MATYHREGDIVFAYSDYQNEIGVVGIAKLVSFVKKGLPFSLNEEGTELYNIEEWEVEWLDKYTYLRNRYKFRVPEKYSSLTDSTPYILLNLQEDKFLETDGIEWY